MPSPKTRNAAASGTKLLARPSGRAGVDAIETTAGEDERQPDPAHDQRHPEPERDDQDEPEGRAPGGDRAEQDQQRAGRGDQAAGQPEDEEAAPRDRRAGRREVAVGDAAVAVFMRPGVRRSWRVLVRVLVVRAHGRERGAVVGGADPPAPATLADQHPAADRHDRDGRDDRRRLHDEVRRQEPSGPDHQGGEDQDAERVRERDRQPEPRGVERRPARPDEVGGHQRLAVAGRQRVAGAERGGGQDRDQQDERREVGGAEDRGQVAAGHAAGDPGGRGRDRGRGGHRRRCRRTARRPAVAWRPTPPGPPRAAATRRRCRTAASVGPPGVATIETDVSASAWVSRFVG